MLVCSSYLGCHLIYVKSLSVYPRRNIISFAIVSKWGKAEGKNCCQMQPFEFSCVATYHALLPLNCSYIHTYISQQRKNSLNKKLIYKLRWAFFLHESAFESLEAVVCLKFERKNRLFLQAVTVSYLWWRITLLLLLTAHLSPLL